ncbi:MAG: hypothetical protein FWD76_01175 [Firmicutes bacterium]|nr:hypothetical protein [Bacillota bacterium]
MTNWSIEDTKTLFDTVAQFSQEGLGLSKAFVKIAKQSGRSTNSVRNFYYSQCKLLALVPKVAGELGIQTIAPKRDSFVTFSEEQITHLVGHILTKRVEGLSVRAILQEYSNGDPVLALRYMNKYRSMLTTHKSRMQTIMHALREQNTPYFNPYTNQVVDGSTSDPKQKLALFLSKLEESEIDSFLDMLGKIVNQ